MDPELQKNRETLQASHRECSCDACVKAEQLTRKSQGDLAVLDDPIDPPRKGHLTGQIAQNSPGADIRVLSAGPTVLVSGAQVTGAATVTSSVSSYSPQSLANRAALTSQRELLNREATYTSTVPAPSPSSFHTADVAGFGARETILNSSQSYGSYSTAGYASAQVSGHSRGTSERRSLAQQATSSDAGVGTVKRPEATPYGSGEHSTTDRIVRDARSTERSSMDANHGRYPRPEVNRVLDEGSQSQYVASAPKGPASQSTDRSARWEQSEVVRSPDEVQASRRAEAQRATVVSERSKPASISSMRVENRHLETPPQSASRVDRAATVVLERSAPASVKPTVSQSVEGGVRDMPVFRVDKAGSSVSSASPGPQEQVRTVRSIGAVEVSRTRGDQAATVVPERGAPAPTKPLVPHTGEAGAKSMSVFRADKVGSVVPSVLPGAQERVRTARLVGLDGLNRNGGEDATSKVTKRSAPVSSASNEVRPERVVRAAEPSSSKSPGGSGILRRYAGQEDPTVVSKHAGESAMASASQRYSARAVAAQRGAALERRRVEVLGRIQRVLEKITPSNQRAMSLSQLMQLEVATKIIELLDEDEYQVGSELRSRSRISDLRRRRLSRPRGEKFDQRELRRKKEQEKRRRSKGTGGRQANSTASAGPSGGGIALKINASQKVGSGKNTAPSKRLDIFQAKIDDEGGESPAQ